ncbi:MAG: hypothetical protein MJ124_09115, partial [Lachnospiraceae bacterium]|nr:hypothetical protein [Lachnospiraceae bacterium]
MADEHYSRYMEELESSRRAEELARAIEQEKRLKETADKAATLKDDVESGDGVGMVADAAVDKLATNEQKREEGHAIVDTARIAAGDATTLKKYVKDPKKLKTYTKAMGRVAKRAKRVLKFVNKAMLLPFLLNPITIAIIIFVVLILAGLAILRSSGDENMEHAGRSVENSVVREVTGRKVQKEWLTAEATRRDALTEEEQARVDAILGNNIGTVTACYKQIVEEFQDSSFTEDDLYEMGIDRESFSYILEEDGDFNTGAVLGNYATITLDIEGDDKFSYYDYDEVHEWMWVECGSGDPGATAVAYSGQNGFYDIEEVDTGTSYSIVDGEYVEDPEGAYYSCGGGYVYAGDVSYMSWQEVIRPTHKLVYVPDAKKRLDFKLTDKWMYQQYPVDFEYYTLFSSYMFMEKHENKYFSPGGDSVYTVEKDELYELGEKLRSEFLFAELPCTKEEDGESIEADVFEAFIRYNGVWKKFREWRDDWKKGVEFKYDGLEYYTNAQIKSLYKKGNAYGDQLLVGEPQKVTWYWLDDTIQQYDVNGLPVEDPVIHKTVTYFPISCLDEVTTLIASYGYHPAVEDLEPKWRDCTGLPNNFRNKYPLTWECIAGDKDFTK